MSGKLKLLSNQLKFSILERNRLVELGESPTQDDEEELKQSLKTLYRGIQALGGNGTAYQSDALQDEIAFLRSEYAELKILLGQEVFEHEIDTAANHVPYRDNPSAAREALLAERSRKSVRFTDTLVDADVSNGELLQMQNQIMRDQDTSLESLSTSIGRQRELSIQIGDELDEHGELIEDMTASVDRSSGRLDQAKQRLTQFSRQAKGNSHLFTIFVLIIILVLLLAIL